MNRDRLVLPPTYLEIDAPLIFLAGPIQGAPNWQGKAIEIIHAANPAQWIASPRRQVWEEGFDYGKQVDWETAHLRLAASRGVILFWLANEANHICTRAYAQTSRFELAEWKRSRELDATIRMVVGIDEGFSNARYIRRRFGQDTPDVPLLDTLEQACQTALNLIG